MGCMVTLCSAGFVERAAYVAHALHSAEMADVVAGAAGLFPSPALEVCVRDGFGSCNLLWAECASKQCGRAVGMHQNSAGTRFFFPRLRRLKVEEPGGFEGDTVHTVVFHPKQSCSIFFFISHFS